MRYFCQVWCLYHILNDSFTQLQHQVGYMYIVIIFFFFSVSNINTPLLQNDKSRIPNIYVYLVSMMPYEICSETVLNKNFNKKTMQLFCICTKLCGKIYVMSICHNKTYNLDVQSKPDRRTSIKLNDLSLFSYDQYDSMTLKKQFELFNLYLGKSNHFILQPMCMLQVMKLPLVVPDLSHAQEKDECNDHEGHSYFAL